MQVNVFMTDISNKISNPVKPLCNNNKMLFNVEIITKYMYWITLEEFVLTGAYQLLCYHKVTYIIWYMYMNFVIIASCD